MSRGLDAKAYLADMADNGISLPTLPRAVVLALHPEAIPRKGKEVNGPFGRIVTTRRSPSVATVSPLGPGPAVAAVTVELLAELGVTTIVAVGIASAVDRGDGGLESGSVAVIEQAVLSGDVSAAYGTSKSASVLLTGRVADVAGARRVSTYCTSVPFRLDVDDVVSSGADVVEMEASALFASAASRGLEVALAVVVSDVTSAEGWRPGVRSVVGAAIGELATTCRELVRELS